VLNLSTKKELAGTSRAVYQFCGWSTDPAFCDDSVVLKSPDMNEIIHDLLGEIVVEHPAHFRSAVQSSSDIEDKYSEYRSFRRGWVLVRLRVSHCHGLVLG
jgi:hypothetical protein